MLEIWSLLCRQWNYPNEELHNWFGLWFIDYIPCSKGLVERYVYFMCVIWIHRPIISLVSYEYGCHCFPALFITHCLLKPTGQRFLFQADDHSSLEIPCLLVQSKTETPVRPMIERYFSLSHPFSLMNFVHVGILF